MVIVDGILYATTASIGQTSSIMKFSSKSILLVYKKVFGSVLLTMLNNLGTIRFIFINVNENEFCVFRFWNNLSTEINTMNSDVVPLLWLYRGRKDVAAASCARVQGYIPIGVVSGRAAKHSCSCAKSEDLRVMQPV